MLDVNPKIMTWARLTADLHPKLASHAIGSKDAQSKNRAVGPLDILEIAQ